MSPHFAPNFSTVDTYQSQRGGFLVNCDDSSMTRPIFQEVVEIGRVIDESSRSGLYSSKRVIRGSENLDLTSPSRILPSKRCGAELRRQNIRTSALPAREVRRLTLMGESLTEPCQLRPLISLGRLDWPNPRALLLSRCVACCGASGRLPVFSNLAV